MSLSINNNASALVALETLNQTQEGLDAAQNAVATGKKVSSAADNPAAYGISAQINNDIAGQGAVNDGLSYASEIVSTSLNAADSIVSTLNDVRNAVTDLIGKNADPDSVKAVKDKLNGLAATINTIARNATVKGVNLLAMSKDDGYGIAHTSLSYLTGSQGDMQTVKSAADILSKPFNEDENGYLQNTADPADKVTDGTHNFKDIGNNTFLATDASGNYTIDSQKVKTNSNGLLLDANGKALQTKDGHYIKYTQASGSTPAKLEEADSSGEALSTPVELTLDNKGALVSTDTNGDKTEVVEASNVPDIYQTATFDRDTNTLKMNGSTVNEAAPSGASGGASKPLQVYFKDAGVLTDALGLTNNSKAGSNGSNLGDALHVGKGDKDGMERVDSDSAHRIINQIANAVSSMTGLTSILGSNKVTINAMSTYGKNLSDSLTNASSSLVDADMAAESAKLTALQTKQSLGVKALTIANGQSQNILSLFQ